MSDPFSVAGTAVGITSLGIQTCQILIRYYSQFRGIHQDIDDVLKRVESLECILERLVAVNAKLSSSESSSNLGTALNSCTQASQRLKDLVDKVGTGLDGKSSQDRLRAARSRLMWPFKKETLADLKFNLSDFQDNLALALQVSALDAAIQTADQLTSTTNHIDGATNRIESELRNQSDVMTSVREGVEGFRDTQREQASIVSQELLQLQARLLAHEESIDKKFHFLISQNNIGIMNRPVPLSLLADTAQAASDAKHHFRRGLEQFDTLTSSSLEPEPQVSLVDRGACTCRGKQKSIFRTYYWKMLLSQTTYQHRTGCPQYSPQDFSRTMEAQITICNRVMQYCVLVGWRQSKRAGWSSSAPVFRYRPVVPSGSGVFGASKKAMNHFQLHYDYFEQPFKSTISIFMDHLRQCYSTGLGSPFDVDEFGTSILIESLNFIFGLLSFGLQDYELVFSVLEPHLDYRMLHDQDNCGRTPIMNWQLGMTIITQSSATEILQYLVRKVDSWTVLEETTIHHMSGEQKFCDILYTVLQSEEALNRFEYDDSLSLAVFRRSDVDFRRYLASESPESILDHLRSQSYRNFLASWPAGLEIFLCSRSAVQNEGYIADLWRDALPVGNLCSIKILLEYGVEPTYGDWFAFHRTIDEERRQREGEKDYGTVFELMAQRLPRIPEDSNKYYLYRYPTLCATAAQALWSAGHRNKSNDTSKHLSEVLWTSISTEKRPWSFVWPVFCWLVDHGADATWVHPVFLTTSAHVVTRIGTLSVRYHLLPACRHQLLNLATLASRDGCTCYCSEGGCTIVGCAVSEYRGTELDCIAFFWAGKTIRSFFFQTVDGNRNLRWISSAILRILTFEKLSLTHTCCHRVLEETGCDRETSNSKSCFARPTGEDAQNIHHVESGEIALLERLLPEFEGAWDNYEGSFEKFMDVVWNPRMKEVRNELRESMKNPEQIFRSTGVYLRKVDGEGVSDTESEDGSWETIGSESSENRVQDEDHEDEYNDNDGYATAAED